MCVCVYSCQLFNEGLLLISELILSGSTPLNPGRRRRSRERKDERRKRGRRVEERVREGGQETEGRRSKHKFHVKEEKRGRREEEKGVTRAEFQVSNREDGRWKVTSGGKMRKRRKRRKFGHGMEAGGVNGGTKERSLMVEVTIRGPVCKIWPDFWFCILVKT